MILDTNAYSAFKRNDKRFVDLIEKCELLIISPILVAELYSGFLAGNRTRENIEEFNLFLQLPKCIQITINSEIAKNYSEIYFNLRRKGTPIPTNDIWLAAICLTYKYPILSIDKHFKNIENIEILPN